MRRPLKPFDLAWSDAASPPAGGGRGRAGVGRTLIDGGRVRMVGGRMRFVLDPVRFVVERLEGRYLLTWIGATSGTTNDASHQYDLVANWSSGAVEDSFSGATFTGNTTLYLAANRTTVGAGINLGYGGSFDLTFKSTSVTTRTLTLAGDIGGTFGGANVTIGDATNGISVALGAATRTVTVSNGQNVTFVNVITGTAVGITKEDAGTLTLRGVNTYTGTTTLNAGQLNINNAKGTGNGPLTINGGSLDNTSGAAITLSNTIAQTWGGDFTFVGSNSLNMGAGAISLGANRTVTVNAGTLTESGIISGAGGLTKAGAGTLTLSGANTYSGGLTLNAGQVNLNSTKANGAGPLDLAGGTIDNTSGGALTLVSTSAVTWDASFTFIGSSSLNMGTGTVTMTGDRTLTVNAGTLTVGGAIGDGGNGYSLTKSGAGGLTLSGANTYSGGTTLSAGQLNINNVTAIGTGAFEIDGGTIDNTSAANITLTTNNAQTWGGDFTFVGTKALNLGTGSVLLAGNRNVSASSITNALTVAGVIGDGGSQFAINKSGAGIVSITGSNTFGGGTNLNAGTLSFGNGSLGGGAVTFAASSTLQWATGNTQDVSASIAAIASGVVATIDTVANAVAFATAIAGQGTLAKIGSGTLSLTVANTLTGGVTLTAGTLNLNDAAALGTGLFTINGGTLNNTSAAAIVLSTNNVMTWAGNFAFTGTKNLDLGTGAVTLSAARTVTGNGGTLTVGGVIGGAFALTKAGAGALTLTNANTYSSTTLSAGTLNINNASAIGAGTLTISGTSTINNTSGGTITLANNNAVALNGNLTFGGTNVLNLGTGTITMNAARSITVTAGTTTVAGVIAGGFALTKAGAGALTLSNANTYTGGTTLSAGTLNINNAAAIGTGLFTITAGTIDNTSGAPITLSSNNTQAWGSFTVGNTNVLNLGTGAVSMAGNRTVTVTTGTFAVASVISGGFSLTKAGAGAMTLNAANTYTGGTVVSAGTLNVNNASAIGTGTLTMSGGTLDNTSGGALTLANNESWGGNFTFAGTNNLTFSGNLVLTASRTYTISAGTLAIGGNVTGAFSVTKAGAGALAFSGTSTYSGGTILTAGELDINSPSAIGTGTLTLNGGTIDNTSGGAVAMSTNNAQTWGSNINFTGSSDLAFGTGTITLTAARTITTAAGTLTLNGVIAGAFALTKAGAGTVITSGNSTFSAGLTINNGSWYANNASGSGTGTGLTTVNSGGTLGGTGAAKAVTVNSGGTLSPGMNGTAVFSTGNLILAAGAAVEITLNGDVAGTDYDGVSVTGTANVSNGTLNFSGTRSTHNGAALAILTNDAADAITGTFSGTPQGSVTTFNGIDYSVNYAGGTGNDLVFSANVIATTTTISADVSSTIYGEAITFTATVAETASDTPTGAVTFYDGGTTLGSAMLDGSAQATLTLTDLGAGTHSITAVYGSDPYFASSSSSAITQAVSQANSSNSIGASTSHSVFGETVTFTAVISAVAPGAGIPTGTITFHDGATILGTSPIDGTGTATLDLTSLAIGTHSVTAIYAGDTNFVDSNSSTITQTVQPAGTSATLTSSMTPTTFGQTVTFTATIAVDSPGTGTPTGTVTFKDGSTVIGAGTLDGSGVATLDIATLGAGSHSVTVVYAGDSNYNGSTSTVITQDVDQATTTTTVGSSIDTTVFRQSTTFTTTVAVTAPGVGIAAGSVTFKDGATILGTIALDGTGSASLAVSTLAAGTHSITAVYSGDSDFIASTAPAITQTVNASATSTALTSSAGPSSFGQSVTLTADVVATAPGGGVPAGTITFRDGTTVLGTVTLDSSGDATYSTSTFSVGAHSITATYDGSANHAASLSSTLTQTVNRSATSSAVVSSVQTSAYGQNVTLTATITATAPGSGVPTGTVTFMDGASVLGTGTLDGTGVATFSTASLSVASHSITVVYGSDTNYAGSTSSTLTQTVNQASTTTTIGTLASAAYGESVTFTATVAAVLPGAGTPGGTVTFMDGASVLGTGTLDGSGVVTCTTSALSVASHSITAVYGGDGEFTSSTSAASTQVVHQAATSAAVTASVGPAAFGESIVFTATVSTTAPGSGIATGTVTFKNGSAVLGTGTLDSSGVATFTTDSLSVGTHSVTVVYAGDTNFAASSSSVSTLVVQQASTAAALSASVDPATFGQSVTFTVAISVVGPGAGTPTGTVTFKDGSTVLGTGALDGAGIATFTTDALAVGSHSISAIYAGDTSFASSTSSVATQAVNQATTTTSLVSSVHPSVFGQSTTFTAHVDIGAPGAGSPGGTITFNDDATVIGTATLDGAGDASITIATLAVGTHSITAAYAGDTSFSASTSSVFTQTVQRAATTTSITASSSPSAFGQSVTFTATVMTTAPGAGSAGGSVTFRDGSTLLGTVTLDGSGAATFVTSDLTIGTHAITATFNGSGDFVASVSAALTQPVAQSATHATLSSSNTSSVFGESVTFTATLAATSPGNGVLTGIVEFRDGSTLLGTATLDGAGTASFSTVALGVGTHSITVVYAGDTNFAASTSASTAQHVGRDSTSVAVTSSSASSVVGQPITFTATIIAIAPGDGIPSGSVTFRDGSTVLGTATLDGFGVASFTTATLGVGSHAITAIYAGDTDDFGSSSSTLTQDVNRADTTTSISASLSSSVFGQSIRLTASVSIVSPGDGVPAGSVTFMDGSTILGIVTVDHSGVATLDTTALSVGDHTISASYSGTTNFAASGSSTLTQSVAQSASSTAVAASVATAAFGEIVILTATVAATSPGDATATGTVTFFDGATNLGSAALDSDGQAVLSIGDFSVGTHDITAIYSGDANVSASTSAALQQVVGQSATATTVIATPTWTVLGDALTFTATVAAVAPGSGLPTTLVTFFDGSIILGTATLDQSGVASLTTTALGVGSHSITVIYAGNSNFTASTSVALAVMVSGSGTQSAVTTSSGLSARGEPITLTATITATASGAGTPNGIVTFKDGDAILGTATLDGSGSATLTTAALAVGSHSITVVFAGNVDFAISTSAVLPQTVVKAQTNTTINSSANPANLGQPITLNVHVAAAAPGGGTPTGAVTFFDGAASLGTARLDSSGSASFSITDFSAGDHVISAQYAGDADFIASSITATTQTIQKGRTLGEASFSVGTSVFGQLVTITATIIAGVFGTPSGTVTFLDGATSLGSATLDSEGMATLTTSALSVGTHAITVAYMGDDNFDATTSAVVYLTVNAAKTTPALVSSTILPSASSAIAPAFDGRLSVLGRDDLTATRLTPVEVQTPTTQNVAPLFTKARNVSLAMLVRLTSAKPSDKSAAEPADARLAAKVVKPSKEKPTTQPESQAAPAAAQPAAGPQKQGGSRAPASPDETQPPQGATPIVPPKSDPVTAKSNRTKAIAPAAIAAAAFFVSQASAFIFSRRDDESTRKSSRRNTTRRRRS